MLLSVFKDVQIPDVIVERISVDMMDDLAGLCSGNLSVFPFSAVPLRAVSKPIAADSSSPTVPMRFLHRSIRYLGLCKVSHWRNHAIAAAHVSASRKAINLLRVGEERIAVAMPHLIVPHTHLSSHDRTIAVSAGATDRLAAPPIFRRAVTLHPLVVHQAKPMRRMFAPASFNTANRHSKASKLPFPISLPDKVLGNSLRIEMVEEIAAEIEAQREAAA